VRESIRERIEEVKERAHQVEEKLSERIADAQETVG
jgi:hypothetical protein